MTHNHPEGIKGAESVASVIYLARSGFDKTYIRDYVIREFGYDLSRTCDEIRPDYHHVESCQETVPEAITAFLEGELTRVTIKLTDVHKEYESTLSASAGDSELLRSELAKLGLKKDELKMLSFGVDTETKSYRDKNDNWQEKFIGYRYTHVMKIEFPSDNKRLGQILYMLANNSVLHPKFQFSFFVKDVETSKNELLGKAVTDAKAKAEVLTSAAGVKLLDILSIDYSWGEIDFEISPMRGDLGYGEYKMALAEPAGYDIDIEPDDIEVSDTVTVVWEIG